MPSTLVFASHNKHKVEEIAQALSGKYELQSLTDIGCVTEIPETGTTLHENALLKARFVHQTYGLDCFADDTGLEIAALNNEPGVYSARYAGEHKSSEDNMDKVLTLLQGKEDRTARFRTVIALILQGKEYVFEGIVEGTIRTERAGTAGFGYDPIFEPKGYDVTFAEMTMEQKHQISHRGRAVELLIAFLATHLSSSDDNILPSE